MFQRKKRGRAIADHEDKLDIGSLEELETWLNANAGDKLADWSRVLALRAALRIWPIALSVHTLPDTELEPSLKQGLILQSWRAIFISSVASEGPTDEMSAALAAATTTEAADAAATTTEAADAALAAADAADAADNADAAAYAAANAADAAANAADAATFTADATAAAAAARAASFATFAAPDADAVWVAISADCAFLLAMERDGVQGLLRSRLWLDDVRRKERYRANFPDWAREPFDYFARDIAKNTPWQLMVDWYRGQLPNTPNATPRNIFDAGRSRELALEAARFWEVTDERYADDIVAEIAEVLGWPDELAKVGKPSPERAASARPRWRNGMLVHEDVSLEGMGRDELIAAAIAGLKEEVAEFASQIMPDGNFDKYPASYLQRTVTLMPVGRPTLTVLMRLIHREAALLDFKASVDEQWPEFRGKEYATLVSQLTALLDEYAERREFARTLTETEVELESTPEARDYVLSASAAMRTEEAGEKIDQSVPTVIEETQIEIITDQSAQGEQLPTLTQTVDGLESVNNTLKQLAQKSSDDPAVRQIMEDIDAAYADGFAEGVSEGAKKAGKRDGERAGAVISRTRTAGVVGGQVGKRLSDRYPKTFGWLKNWL